MPADRVLEVVVFDMDAGASFEAHVHAEHQLAWASEGVLTVDCGNETWVLPPTRALWIPAGVRHETRSSGPAIMRTAYIDADRSPFAFERPTPIGAGQLLAELITYLAEAALHPLARTRAEMVLFDVLTPVSNSAIELRMPSDDRALDVARAIIADPSDGRDLGDWGDLVGASARTLARAFAETGVTFG
ncbi:MAG: AraC family ligand binding domain-containing protein, partial [Acidimicrobiales bacterium]